MPRFLSLLVLLLATMPASADPVTIEVGKEALAFKMGDTLVTRYLIDPKLAKPVFYPVLAPGEVPLTRAWPLEKGADDGSHDHPHQKSVWFCHGDVIPEGLDLKLRLAGVEGVDFWSEGPGRGRIVCTSVGEPRQEKDHAWVRTENEWRASDGTKLLDEARTLHLHDLGAARLLVLDIDLHPSVCPLTFGDTKEGSLGTRVNDAIRAEKNGKGRIENAEGKRGERDCWGQISAWCDYSGPIDGKEAGLTVLADPKNPVPTCWHVRGYGLMAANPFGRAKSKFPAVEGTTNLVHLAKGEHLRLRYGLLLHSGDAAGGHVAEAYRRFVALGK